MSSCCLNRVIPRRPSTTTKAISPGFQRLIDDKALRADQTAELQALGAVLGQVFAATTPLRWVVVEDQYGRDLALQYPNTTVIVFPMTMILKRVKDGRDVDIVPIYRTIAAQVEKMKDDPEYQRNIPTK